jgi:hypothetical protein
MRTVDRLAMRATPARVFEAASNVEQWPALLPHYRWVRMLERRAGGGVVEMAAWRPFGPVGYPTWWVYFLWTYQVGATVGSATFRGLTAGMDVEWSIIPTTEGSDVTIVHEWNGPGWPLVGRPAADLVIGPVFIHGIASRTLAGIQRAVERPHA